MGPPAFDIFINDLPQRIRYSGLLLFADDGKIYHVIECVHDAEEPQCDLDAFALWCSNNSLPLNVNKCKVVRLTNKKDPIIFEYKLDNKPVTSCKEIKDLGVLFSANGKFNEHISKMVSKALRTLGLIN